MLRECEDIVFLGIHTAFVCSPHFTRCKHKLEYMIIRRLFLGLLLFFRLLLHLLIPYGTAAVV